MTPAWAQRQAELFSDCIVSPDVFNPMVDRLGDFVVPYQHALQIEAGPHHMSLYLQGLLSHLPRKNAEEIAVLVDVDRQVTGVCVLVPTQGNVIAALGSCPPKVKRQTRRRRPEG